MTSYVFVISGATTGSPPGDYDVASSKWDVIGAGGGGASISLSVNGLGGQDLANYLKEKINQGIREYKYREKFT